MIDWNKYDNNEVKSWTCEQVVKYVHHELIQKSGSLKMIATSLIHEDDYGNTEDFRKKLYIILDKQADQIISLTAMVGTWLTEKVSNNDEHSD